MPKAGERACTTYVLRSQPWLTTLAAGIPANTPAWWSAKQRRNTAWSKQNARSPARNACQCKLTALAAALPAKPPAWWGVNY